MIHPKPAGSPYLFRVMMQRQREWQETIAWAKLHPGSESDATVARHEAVYRAAQRTFEFSKNGAERP